MDTVKIDSAKHFQDEETIRNLPRFDWFNTGQFILNFQTPQEIVNRMNTLYDDLMPKKQLPLYNKKLIGKVKNEWSVYLDDDNSDVENHNFIPDDIHEWIKDRIHQYLNWVGWHYVGIKTSNAWINDYNAKEFNPLHIHLGSSGVSKQPLNTTKHRIGLIGMMCLKTPSHYGEEFTNADNPEHNRAGFTEFVGSCPGKQFAGQSVCIRMNEGNFVVFPYDTQHVLYPHFNENETRRTFPTNIDVYT